MRSRVAAAMLAGLLACGKSATKPKDADVVPTEAVIDAPSLPVCANPVSGSTIKTRQIGNGAKIPSFAVLATSPPDDLRLFVVGTHGTIHIFKNEMMLPTPFIDLGKAAGGPVTVDFQEEGLLGLAFHPKYADNGQFFVYYTTGNLAAGTLRDVVSRCAVSPTDPDRAQPSCVEVLSIADGGETHNGGMIEFGNDGLLYIGTGDGGGPNQATTSQDPNQLLGKLLRIDVDHKAPGKEYGIPTDNPYAAGGGAPEIFMSGLRNPWRWSFDRKTGDLWIGDVGRSAIEELDVLAPSEQRGANLGWSMYEGSVCATPPCDPTGKVFPKSERARAATHWAAIIGGQVYRGTCFPDIVGWYFYADNAIGAFAKAQLQNDGTLKVVDLTGTFPTRPASIHADARGELYMTDIQGFVYAIEAGP